MHVDKKQRDKPSAYNDWSLRWAEKVNDKFAFKIERNSYRLQGLGGNGQNELPGWVMFHRASMGM